MAPQPSDTIRDLDDVENHDHLCLFYETPQEQVAIAAPFLAQGLQRGERCVYIAPQEPAALLRRALRNHDLDVEHLEQTDTLSILQPEDHYLHRGAFSPHKMVDDLFDIVQQTQNQGYPALRVVGDTAWALKDEPTLHGLCAYESEVNRFFDQCDSLAICLYDINRFPVDRMLELLHAHPHLLIGRRIYPNAYYVPPTSNAARAAKHPIKNILDNLQMHECASEEMHLLNKTLDARVQVRTRSLQTANKVLQVEIDEHNRAEAALRKTNQKLETIIQASPLAIITLDLDGRVTAWNPAAEQIFGWRESECLGKILPIVPDREFDRFQSFLNTIRQGKSIAGIPVERRHKDGSVLHISLSAAPLTDENNRVIGYLGILADITRAKHNETLLRQRTQELSEHIEALCQSEERFRLLVSGVKDYAIFMLDPEGHIASWNEGARQINGYEESEILGRHFSQFYPDIDRQAQKPQRELKLAIEHGRLEDVGWRLRKNGSKFWASVIITPMRDEQGRLRGFTKVTRDMTEQKRAEDAREKAERELEQQRLISMRSDRLRSLGEMATSMAHELNQPLVGIRGMAERFLLRLERGNPLTEAEAKKHLHDIIGQADRMAHMVEHTRLFARQAGKPETRSVQPNNVVRQALSLLEVQLRTRGIQVECRLANDLPEVQANPYSLEEVVINLLLNARDAVLERREKEPDLARPHIVIRTTRNQHQVQLEIIDRGIGIPDTVQPQLFEPFFTTKPPELGTGLGLPVSKSIVEQFGGHIALQQNPDGGAIAIVTLPESHTHAQNAQHSAG